MGFNHTGTKLLIYARSKGFTFGKTLMIGRQGLHVNKSTLQNSFSEFKMNDLNAGKILKEENGYAEPFLNALGATTTDSLDASDYEGAKLIHDMNLPISDKYKNSYDTVIDSGSLEHIFNFPVAIKNCMELLKLNGYFIGITPANNFFGHGFYQFSPELYFRVFDKANGFKMEQLLFFVDRPGSDWYAVKDADELKERVTLSNSEPSYLFIMAKKIAEVNIFEHSPQQSDYQNLMWKQTATTSSPSKRSLMKRIFKRIERDLSNWSTRISRHFRSLGASNKTHFKKINIKEK